MSAPRKAREQEIERPAAEKREPTATERIAALNERRSAGNGYLVAPPEPLTAESFRGWLHAVAEVGSPGDVEIAWHRCQNAHVKAKLNHVYEALKGTAGIRYSTLMQQAICEQEADHAASERYAARVRIKQQIAQHKAAIAVLEQKLS